MVSVPDWKVARLNNYLRAERMILNGQSYTLEGRTLTRADLGVVRKVIDELTADGVTPEGIEEKRRSVRTVFME